MGFRCCCARCLCGMPQVYMHYTMTSKLNVTYPAPMLDLFAHRVIYVFKTYGLTFFWIIRQLQWFCVWNSINIHTFHQRVCIWCNMSIAGTSLYVFHHRVWPFVPCHRFFVCQSKNKCIWFITMGFKVHVVFHHKVWTSYPLSTDKITNLPTK